MTTGVENGVMESLMEERGQPTEAGKRRKDPDLASSGGHGPAAPGFGFLASGTVREYNSVISSHQVWGPVLRSPEETHDKCRQNTSRGQSGNIWKTYAPSLSMHDFPPRNYSELRVEDLSEISRIFTEAFFQGNEEKNLHVQ